MEINTLELKKSIERYKSIATTLLSYLPKIEQGGFTQKMAIIQEEPNKYFSLSPLEDIFCACQCFLQSIDQIEILKKTPQDVYLFFKKIGTEIEFWNRKLYEHLIKIILLKNRTCEEIFLFMNYDFLEHEIRKNRGFKRRTGQDVPGYTGMYDQLRANIQALELETSLISELIHDDFFNTRKEFPLKNLEQQMDKAFLLANWGERVVLSDFNYGRMSTSVHSNSKINNIDHDVHSILNNINSLGCILMMKIISGIDKIAELNRFTDTNTDIEEVSHETYKNMYIGDFQIGDIVIYQKENVKILDIDKKEFVYLYKINYEDAEIFVAPVFLTKPTI